jgi:phosphopantothenoylcysteine decarboxylase / phosphopantothenate---cysteine ligase
VVLGFAAETGNLERHARAKWARKPCDLLAANLVGKEGSGFDSDQNELKVFVKGSRRALRLGPGFKSRLAEELLDLVRFGVS